jgi:hypothetical protein
MPNYLVSYDLDKPGPQDYDLLDDTLKSMGGTRVLYSQWLVKTELSGWDLEETLMGYIDPNTDSMLVVQIDRGHSSWNRLMISDDAFRKLLAG